MQERKMEDSKIWEAYHRLMQGESLTKVSAAEDINLNRGTLRKYIELVVVPELDAEEKAKFEQVMSSNFRGNSTEKKRENRSSKKVASAEDLSEQIKSLAELGVTGMQIEALYTILRRNKHTAYARDTFTFKCVEHFRFFSGIGIPAQEAFYMFMRDPKSFTSDTRALQEKYSYFLRKTQSREEAREALLRNPRGRHKDLETDDYRKNNNVAVDAQINVVTDAERGEV